MIQQQRLSDSKCIQYYEVAEIHVPQCLIIVSSGNAKSGSSVVNVCIRCEDLRNTFSHLPLNH